MSSITEKPKVSVLMPVYKTQESHLRESIESILNQTFKDFEFLILDDCPLDDREEIVKSYDDTRIKYQRNEMNLGISASRNKLIDWASGEYLAVFDHDDISVPTRLEKQVEYLDSHPEVGCISGQLEYFPNKYITKHPEHNIDIKFELMRGCFVAHTAMMLRKSILTKFNIRYEEQYSPAEDYKLVLSLVPYTMFHNIQEVLVKYRNDEGNTSHRQREKMIDADALCRCFSSKEYPYLYKQHEPTRIEHGDTNQRKGWVRLFGCIPFIKIKKKPKKTKVLLFGFLPLFSIKWR